MLKKVGIVILCIFLIILIGIFSHNIIKNNKIRSLDAIGTVIELDTNSVTIIDELNTTYMFKIYDSQFNIGDTVKIKYNSVDGKNTVIDYSVV